MAETQRIVPGAPPPAPLSKSQRKKRKAKSKPGDLDAPAEHELTPELPDINEGSVTAQVMEPEVQIPESLELKSSPIVELINKRLKATAKKIVNGPLSLFLLAKLVF
jgi:hypothetical protein